MHLDDDERRRLADIEANLTDTDPALVRLFRRSQRFLTARNAPSWLALGASVLLMSAGAAVVSFAARHNEPWLDIAALALLVLGVLTVGVSIRRSTRNRAPRFGRSRLPATDERRGLQDVRDSVVVATDGGAASDSAIRVAVSEAEYRAMALLVVMNYKRPIDPDLDDIDTPVAELEARARDRATSALCRALSLPADGLPTHRIVTEHRELTYVLLRGYADAALIVVSADRRPPLRHLFGGYLSTGRLARRSRAPVLVVPSSP